MDRYWSPHGYQRRARDFALDNEHSALFLEPGLGKTSIMLSVLLHDKLVLENPASTLVVAPVRVCHNVWPREAAKWPQFRQLDVVNLHGMKSAERRNARADVLLINPESLTSYLDSLGESLPFDNLVIDESTSFKNPRSKRFAAVKKILPRMRRRHILTGTPCPQSRADLWAQCFILDRGRRFGRSFGGFRRRWFVDRGERYPMWEFRAELAEAFDGLVGELGMSMRTEDYLDLPARIDSMREVDLPVAARREYVRMEEELFAELDEDRIEAVHAAARTLKLQQMANGFVYDEDGAWHAVHDAKLDAVDELLGELGGSPAIVAVGFRADVERLRERHPETPYVGSGVGVEETSRLIDAWNAGDVPLLAIHPRSMGHGVNMQDGGDHVIWFGPTWSVEGYQQLNARVHRQGRERPVFVHHVVARSTVDFAVMRRLSVRERNQDAVMGALDALRGYRAESGVA